MILPKAKIYSAEECPQGSPQWHATRAGVVTASKFDAVLAKGEGKTRRTYLYELAGEIITGNVEEGYKNADMARGNAMEPEARSLFELVADAELQQIGFIKRGRIGGSPDSLIGDDGVLEIKTKKPALQIALLESGKFPSEHKAQVQGLLLVTDRRYCQFMSYWPGLPPFICRVERDEVYIKELGNELQAFIVDLDELVNKWTPKKK